MAESNLHPDQEAQKRRSTRIVQAVPLTVTGVDALGRPFQERTSTLIINCHGARYQSKHYVLKNMWVTLEVPHNEAWSRTANGPGTRHMDSAPANGSRVVSNRRRARSQRKRLGNCLPTRRLVSLPRNRVRAQLGNSRPSGTSAALFPMLKNWLHEESPATRVGA